MYSVFGLFIAESILNITAGDGGGSKRNAKTYHLTYGSMGRRPILGSIVAFSVLLLLFNMGSSYALDDLNDITLINSKVTPTEIFKFESSYSFPSVVMAIWVDDNDASSIHKLDATDTTTEMSKRVCSDRSYSASSDGSTSDGDTDPPTDPTNTAPGIEAITAQIGLTDETFTYSVMASDVDTDDTLTYSISTTPSTTSAPTIDDAGYISWDNPVADTYSVTVTVSDGTDSTDISFGLIISAPPPPPNTAPTIEAITAQTGLTDGKFMYNVMASDVDTDDTLTYSISTTPSATSAPNIDDAGYISWDSPVADTYSVTVTVSDGTDSTDISFGLTISAAPPPPNTAPTIETITAQTGLTDETFTYSVMASDVDTDDTLTYSISTTPSATSAPNIDDAGYISWDNPVADTYSVTVTVSDGTDSTDISFGLIISTPPPPSGTAPTIEPIDNQEETTDGKFMYHVIANATDPTDTLTYSISTTPSATSAPTIDYTGYISWNNPVAGTYTVTVTVDDGTDSTDISFGLTISAPPPPPPNTAPTIEAITAQTGLTDETFTYSVMASDVDTDDTLTYSISTTPSATSAPNIDDAGYISWDNPVADTYSVTVTVSDGTEYTDESFTLTISAPKSFSMETILTGLITPWDAEFTSDGKQLFFTTKNGQVHIMYDNGTSAVLLDTTVSGGAEGGMLGIALDPEFGDKNDFVYVYLTTYVDSGYTNQVNRYNYTATTLIHDGTVIDTIPGGSTHNGGRIAFGSDDLLYITTGDTRSSINSNDTNSLAGKILRVHSNGSIPSDNPYDNAVYAYGIRNSQGLAWDADDALYATDHGPTGDSLGNAPQYAHDEINKIILDGNYGWPNYVGNSHDGEGVTAPIIHSGETTWAPSGLAYITNSPVSDWNGKLMYGALRGEHLGLVSLDGQMGS